MAITMKDIARDLGVSVVTVSKVLRNHSDISAKTRKRVRPMENIWPIAGQARQTSFSWTIRKRPKVSTTEHWVTDVGFVALVGLPTLAQSHS